jgi:magnesium chelatase family protein
MTVARTLAIALTGVSGSLVEIEADLTSGLPGLAFTGLADVSVVESRDRIRSAIVNSGARWLDRRVTLALLPADVRKVGSRFDLAIALAVLAATGAVDPAPIADAVWLAELGLDGALRPVRGALPAVLAARRAGVRRVVVARANGGEAALVDSIDVRVAGTLREVLDWLGGTGPVLEPATVQESVTPAGPGTDLSDVGGQGAAKRALEVAAAGRHHIYLSGPPGTGKTMLAERLPGLLPELDDEAALEVSAIHSVAGTLPADAGLLRQPPLQAPHHTATVASLVGGGAGYARPGAISLADQGVLFLDEAPEFSSAAIEALRQPLESGEVVIYRAFGSVRFPAHFQLVLAANPCPCGRRAFECECAPQVVRRYRQRLSGPLLDRVDVRVVVDAVSPGDLFADGAPAETSAVVAQRVALARAAARQRWAASHWRVNGSVPGRALRDRPWRLPRSVLAEAEAHLERGELSARGFDRVLRMAWTVADLAGHTAPDAGDVAEALFYRVGRGSTWAA